MARPRMCPFCWDHDRIVVVMLDGYCPRCWFGREKHWEKERKKEKKM